MGMEAVTGCAVNSPFEMALREHEEKLDKLKTALNLKSAAFKAGLEMKDTPKKPASAFRKYYECVVVTRERFLESTNIPKRALAVFIVLVATVFIVTYMLMFKITAMVSRMFVTTTMAAETPAEALAGGA